LDASLRKLIGKRPADTKEVNPEKDALWHDADRGAVSDAATNQKGKA